MNSVGSSFVLALRDVWRPRLWGVLLLPLLGAVALGAGLGWLFWDEVAGGVLNWFAGLAWVQGVQARLSHWGMASWLGATVSAFVGFVLLLGLMLVLSLLVLVLASALLAPWVAEDVARRCYPHLARRGDLGFWQSLGWSLKALLQAGGLLLLCLPLGWLPLVHLLVPPLILGWLNSRVMAFDVLSAFAPREELLALLRRHRRSLLIMGVVAGWLSLAPALTWLSGLLFVALFFVLMPLAAVIYLAVLLLTALWFSHFALRALHEQRIGAMYHPVSAT